jgi:peptide subunit release factor 1 (eRF1)
MLTESDLRELLKYQPGQTVMSLYLNTDPSEGSADGYKLRLRTMLKDIDLPEDVDAVERYFATQYDWAGRSVAVFSCAPDGFLRTYALAVPLRSRVRINEQPHVKPLADLLDAFGGYGVALVDKQGARLFYFHLGELREQGGVLGEDIHHTKRGGASTVPGRRGGVAGTSRHEEEVTERNMKESVDFAVNFFSENHVRRVLLGGTDENVSQFRSHLPKTWQSLVVGSFHMSMTASHAEVLEKAMKVGHEAEQHREAQLVDNLVTSAAKGHGGVVRLPDTLTAVHDGRVLTLLIREGLREPGYRCTGCGFVTAQEHKKCPYCEGAFEKIPDAVEMAVHQVMQQGGEVEVLHNEALTSQFGHIGALLRY